MNCIASARVATSERNSPRTDEVTVTVPGFFTPRIDMQRCSASITTSTPRGESTLGDGVGDLGRHALLDLQAPGVAVDQAGQLGQPGDAAVLGRDVGDVGLAQERHQVVLAQRGERDVAHHHHLVVLGGEGDLEVAGRVVVEAREELLVHGGHPVRAWRRARRGRGPRRWRSSSSAHGRPHPLDVDAHLASLVGPLVAVHAGRLR